MIYFIAFLSVVLLIAAPLFLIYRRVVQHGKRGKAPLIVNLCAFFGVMLVISLVSLGTGAMAANEAAADAAADTAGLATGLGYIGAALAVGLSGIGGGIAVSGAASAALGAISENDKIFGKSLIFVGLAEGVALYGLIISFMIIMNL